MVRVRVEVMVRIGLVSFLLLTNGSQREDVQGNVLQHHIQVVICIDCIHRVHG